MSSSALPPAGHPAPEAANGETGRPALDDLVRQVLACPRDDKRLLLYRLLRDLLGDNPKDEYGIYHPDGSSYMFLVSPPLHARFHLTPERLAEWLHAAETGPWVPFSETVAK